MRFDTKIAVIIRDDLPTWQKLNVTAFLASGVAAANPDAIGEPYQDGSDRTYLPLLGQPVLIFSASAEQLRAAYERIIARELPCAIFTDQLFATGNDDDNRAVVRAVASDALEFAGVALRGPRNAIDKITKGLALHA